MADGARMCSKMAGLYGRQRSAKLAEVCDRYRTKADVRPLLAEKLRPINEGRTRPESTLPVPEFVENCYLPFVRENYKPSTSIGYDKVWKKYLAPRLRKTLSFGKSGRGGLYDGADACDGSWDQMGSRAATRGDSGGLRGAVGAELLSF